MFLSLLTIACETGGAPVRLERIAGDAQLGVAGVDLPQPLVVRVTDAGGGGVADVEVVWLLGADARMRFTGRTNAYGLARAVWVLDPHTREQHATARVPGLPPVTFSATATRTRARPAAPRAPRIARPDVGTITPSVDLAADSGWTARAGTEGLAAGPPVLHGRLHAADGAPASDVVVHIRTRLRSETVQPVGDAFVLLLSEAEVREPIDVFVQSAGAAGRYLPVRFRADVRGGQLPVILIPREWRLRSGSYGGSVVAIDLQRALQPACRGCPSFYRYARAAAGGLSARTAAWPAEALPLRVSFAAGDSLDSVTAADSAAFWRIADAFDRAFGADLLRRADGADAERSLRIAVDRRQLNAGESTTAMQAGEIFAAEITLQRPGLIAGPLGTYLVTHELLHTLGFGHTCSWRSVLADPRACPDRQADWLMPEDVAYVQLLNRIHDLERRSGARGTIDAALDAAAQSRE